MKITFINSHRILQLDKPQPADKFIPDWYKDLNSYISGKKGTTGKGDTTGTIKRCMPVFDALTVGYIITTPADLFVSQKDGEPYYEWPSLDLIQFHNVEQAPTHPKRNDLNVYPKFTNYWGVKTPKGYSCLFVQPFHRDAPFTILPGIVDTDTYSVPVNFPFVLNDKNFEGLIPVGTPMAQVIPFKRESWQMEIGSEEDIEESFIAFSKIRLRFFDAYKTLFRSTKEYK